MKLKILEDIANKISRIGIKLPKNSSDGRVNSIESERKISNFIKKNTACKVEIPADRSWYDIKIDRFFCNIKVSEMTGNDNTIGKAVIYYLLTGLEKAPNHYEEFFKSMKANENKDEARDFYFIVVRKRDSQAFIINLKDLDVIIAPNNPPFQCNWSKNLNQTNRDWESAKNYLLKSWAESLKRRAEQQIKVMKQYYPASFS